MESKNPSPKTKKETVRITIDLPESKWLKMKTELLKRRMSIKDCFMEFLDKEFDEKPA